MNVDLVDHMGTDLTVVNAARVSFDKTSSTLDEKDIKLINYLARHNHWSPFSHCFLQFRVKAPIFIARQLAKHQVGLSWNEVSRRYVDSEPEFYEPDTWRGKPENVKQGSEGEAKSQYFPNLYIGDVTQLALTNYNKMITQGVAPEMARMILPQNMYTEWYWSGSLYAFSRVCQLRLDKTSQIEVQQVARQISAYCTTKFPHSWNALTKENTHEQTST
jgi:thymidylate synthase (FAD)